MTKGSSKASMFPKIMYIYRMYDNYHGPLFDALPSIDRFSEETVYQDGDAVAVYEFKEIKRLKKTVALE